MSVTQTLFKKSDAKKQIVFAEVYAPNVLDTDGDFMTAEDIETMAYSFMKSLKLKNVDLQHNNQLQDACIVESFIAREGDTDFIPGSWVVGVHIADPKVWDMVEKGEVNGFSMETWAKRVPSDLEINIPPTVKGDTTPAEDGHYHAFKVAFDKDGNFLGGMTDESEGHAHVIKRGTATETTDGHNHRFSCVEGFYA